MDERAHAYTQQLRCTHSDGRKPIVQTCQCTLTNEILQIIIVGSQLKMTEYEI